MSQTETQITPLDVLITGIYKAQSRGAYNLNEAAILAKAVQHFGQRQMINQTIMKQINGQNNQNLDIIEEEVSPSAPNPVASPKPTPKPTPEPIPKPTPERNQQLESKPKVSITDDDLSEIYVIGGNKNKQNKSNLRMVIEDDED
jgi:hypothetical protein